MASGRIAKEARAGSGVDLVVEFSVPVGLFEFVRLRRFHEEILCARVDLATAGSPEPQLREAVLREAVRAA
jgi:hypothetical protein